jgi:aminopeptidase YwaD
MENQMDQTLPILAEHAFQHIQKLSVEIGPRLSSTPANLAASEYIRQKLSDLGYEIEMQLFDAPAWREIGVTLEAEGSVFPAAANTFSPACSLTAPLVSACTLAELKAADLFGKIALLYGDLTKTPISPKSWFLISEWESQLVGLLEAGQPAAVITVQTRPGDIERVTEDWEFKIPSLVVSAQTGRQLLLLPPQVQIQVEIEAILEPGQTANLVARKKGSGRAVNLSGRIVMMAHYDTKPDTPGALDNASGVGVLLALAERFAEQELNCTLELIAFANEESIPIGDEEYLRRGEGYFPEITAAINFDGVGQIVAANSITAISCSPEFESWVKEQAQEFSGVVWVEPWPQSNHSTFAWRGVPSLAFSSSGRFHNDHLRSDTIEWISPAKLAEVIDLASAIITGLQDRPPGWTRPA